MGEEKTFVAHNYKADFENSVTQGQKANGEIQIKEVKTKSDVLEGLLERNLNLIIDWYTLCKKKHIKAVSPYEKGHEPNV